MEPVLSKHEVNNLLEAIKEGRVSLDTEEHQQSVVPNLECSEVDLFQVSSTRKDNIRIPNFDIILDAFCQNYSISLSNQLQRTFSITRTGLESMPYQDYLLAKENPGSLGVLDLAPLKHGALVQFAPFAFTNKSWSG